MKLELLKTEEQFKQLKKNDLIMVEWSEGGVEHTPKAKPIMLYEIYEIKDRDKEIICQRKYNHYFNYGLYLKKSSVALNVYRIHKSICDYSEHGKCEHFGLEGEINCDGTDKEIAYCMGWEKR